MTELLYYSSDTLILDMKMRAVDKPEELESLLGATYPKEEESIVPTTNYRMYQFGVAAAVCYSLTYFWRYPIFVLPLDVLEQKVFTLFGKDVDLQVAFSLALTLGFGLAKLPAISIMSSEFFFKNRFPFILSIGWIAVVLMSVGTSLFYDILGAQVMCVFFSCFFSSWIYGALITYLEGRTETEVLLALMNFFYIYAGNLSRGTGSLLLTNGVRPSMMPMLLGVVCGPLFSLCLYITNKSPPPSQLDMTRRSVRLPLTASARWSFLVNNSVGLVCLLLPYALMSVLRSFRDFYVQEIFTAALGRSDSPPPYVYFTVDIPGAILSCLIQYLFHYCESNIVAFVGMLSAMCVSIFIMLLSTIIYDGRTNVTEWSGYCWQVAVGIGIYVAYGILGTAAWDRLVSLLEVGGTCSFLVFMADGFGYISTTTLLLYQIFGTSSDGDDDVNDDNDNKKYLDLFLLLVYASNVTILFCLFMGGTFFVWKSNKYSELRNFFSFEKKKP